MHSKSSAPAFGYGFRAPTAPLAATGESEPSAARAPAPAGVIGLVDDDGAAAFFGCSKRTFSTFMDAPWMVKPIRLGPRLRRWSIDELRAAVAAMPREVARPAQPSALRARINALKGAPEAGRAQQVPYRLRDPS